MRLKDNLNFPTLRGHLTIKTLDSATGKVLSVWEKHNVIVNGSTHALINGIATTTTTNNQIETIVLGSDLGELMTGNPSVTFSGSTATRASGSFLTDGFAIGDFITVQGTVSNNTSLTTGLPLYYVTNVTATVITIGAYPAPGYITVNGIQYTPTTTFVTETSTTAAISRGSIWSPSAPLVTYNNTTMANESFVGHILYPAPSSAISVGVVDSVTLAFNCLINGADCIAYTGGSQAQFTSASLNTGDGNAFAYQRFPATVITAVINISIIWQIGY